MTGYTKPCARGGCTGTIHRRWACHLRTAQFCSQRCTYLERLRRGSWINGLLTLTPEARLRGARRSGQIVGARRTRMAAVAAAERAFALLPEDIVDVLTREQFLRLKVACGRIWREGRRVGYRADHRDRAKHQEAA